MSVSVIVERAPGDKQGPDISDALIVNETVATEKGRNEIDRDFSNREAVSGSGPLKDMIRQGSMVEIMDSEQSVWRGLTQKVALVLDLQGVVFTADTHLEIEREATK